jgi:predicted DNA-binding transcriptional regulator YafY
VAEHLAERPLSADQTLKPTADGQVEARASVLNTQELRWWLLGFGDAVEVLGPAPLRRAFRDIAGRLHQRYTT